MLLRRLAGQTARLLAEEEMGEAYQAAQAWRGKHQAAAVEVHCAP
jgi:hypothetical protein